MKRLFKFGAKLLLVEVIVCLCFASISGANERKSLAVVSFKNLTEDKETDWIGAGFASTAANKLANIQSLRVVEREQLRAALDEIALGMSGIIDPKTAQKAGRVIGVEYIVIGDFQKFGSQIKVNSRIIEVETAIVVKTESVHGEINNVFNLQDELALKMAEAIDIPISPSEKTRIEAKPTTSLTAYEHYSKGVLSEDKGDPLGAFEQYKRATQEDPAYQEARNGEESARAKITRLVERFNREYPAEFSAVNPGTVLESFEPSENYKIEFNSRQDKALVKWDATIKWQGGKTMYLTMALAFAKRDRVWEEIGSGANAEAAFKEDRPEEAIIYGEIGKGPGKEPTGVALEFSLPSGDYHQIWTGEDFKTLNGDLDIPGDVAAGDLDGDGEIELVASTYGDKTWSGYLVVYEREGDRFIPVWQSEPCGERLTASLQAADIDQDGKNEIIVGGYQGNLLVYAYTGRGYSLKSKRNFGDTVWRTTTGDIDGDGQPEIIVGMCSGDLRVVEARRGNLEIVGQSTNQGDYPDGLVTADVDGDGREEILTTNRAGFVYVLRWDGNRFNKLWRSEKITNAFTLGKSLEDLDGNGKIEIVCSSQAQVVLLEWDGSNFSRKWSSPGLGSALVDDIDIGDTNGNRTPEVAFDTRWGDVLFYEWDGLQFVERWNLSGYTNLKLKDIDKDGKDEILVLKKGQGGAISIFDFR